MHFVHRALRALIERATAQLKIHFTALRNVGKYPWKISDFIAVFVLFPHENQRTV